MTNPKDQRVEAAVDAVIKSRGWSDNCWGDGAIGGFNYSTDTKPRHVIRDHEAEAKEGKTVILFETEDYDEYQREYRRICIRREVRAALKAADEAAWQQIESAPKDGTQILAYDSGERVLVEYLNGNWWSDHGCTFDPTHWQPLPTPPETP